MFTGAHGTRAYWTLAPQSQEALGAVVQGKASTFLTSTTLVAVAPNQYTCPLLVSDIALNTESAWLLWGQEQKSPPIVATIKDTIVTPKNGGSLQVLLSAPETIGWYTLLLNLLGIAPDSGLPAMYQPMITVATGLLGSGVEVSKWIAGELSSAIRSQGTIQLELSRLHIEDAPAKATTVAATPLARLLLPKGL